MLFFCFVFFTITVIVLKTKHLEVKVKMLFLFLYISMQKYMSDCGFRICRFKSLLCHIHFIEIDHVIISTVILPLILLIQEGQLAVTIKSMCTCTGSLLRFFCFVWSLMAQLTLFRSCRAGQFT